MSKQVEYYYSYDVVSGVIVSALHDPRLTFSAVKVLGNLIGVHANNKHPFGGVDEKGRKVGCFPSYATIASELQISISSVETAIKLLWKLGYIKIRKSKVNNVHQRNEYLIERNYKTKAEIQAEGKARRQPGKEDDKQADLEGSVARPDNGSCDRVHDPFCNRVHDPLCDRVHDPLCDRYGSNVDNHNVDNHNVEKERSGFAVAPSSSPLDASKVDLSRVNEVDLSPKVLSSTIKSSDAPSSSSLDASTDDRSSPEMSIEELGDEFYRRRVERDKSSSDENWQAQKALLDQHRHDDWTYVPPRYDC